MPESSQKASSTALASPQGRMA
ncbi:hypothetical protein A2U01_0107504, partial [Trifolium medium]|nr:hypothetical protein [Trifolium medium]